MMMLKKGRFEFTVTGMGTWTSKFILTVLPDGYIDVHMLPNDDLSALMLKHLATMQERFETELRTLYN